MPLRSEEDRIQKAICEYLDLQYPNVLYYAVPNGASKSRFDQWRFKVTGLKSGVPDIVIAEPRHGKDELCYGLYLEIKVKRKDVFKKDGELRKSEHLHRQSEWHRKLRDRGYVADFYFGFDECKSVIDKYLKGEL